MLLQLKPHKYVLGIAVAIMHLLIGFSVAGHLDLGVDWEARLDLGVDWEARVEDLFNST